MYCKDVRARVCCCPFPPFLAHLCSHCSRPEHFKKKKTLLGKIKKIVYTDCSEHPTRLTAVQVYQ